MNRIPLNLLTQSLTVKTESDGVVLRRHKAYFKLYPMQVWPVCGVWSRRHVMPKLLCVDAKKSNENFTKLANPNVL